MKKMSINPVEYVVLDVETNGLSSKRDDLLSISLYKPDDEKEYNKFLPLELNKKIVTSHINGITNKDLVGATALTQLEYDNLVSEFELDKRVILIYAGKGFDSTFLSAYMKRHKISGFEKLKFYNIKRNVISSKYSTGNITKDNLCKLFKIDNVSSIHTSLNDCKLEWQLFQKMNGSFYLVTPDGNKDNVFLLNDDYIIPASLLITHPNLSRLLINRPYIECQSTVIKSFEIDAKSIEKFPNNITGVTIEHLINSMLDVDKQNSMQFLLENKMKLRFVGKIPNDRIIIPMIFNQDGTITALNEDDEKIEQDINATLNNLKKQLSPLISFIKHEIFQDQPILSQELVVDYENNILALCDLSNENAVLEIKTTAADSLAYKEQFFYEARGRSVYHLKMDWIGGSKKGSFKKIIFRILSVDVHVGTPNSSTWFNGKLEEKRAAKIEDFNKRLSSSDLSLISFTNTQSPIIVQCKNCGYEWAVSYATLNKKIPKCPQCNPKPVRYNKPKLSEEELRKLRADNYYDRILLKSNNTISATNYTGAKSIVDAVCNSCGHRWKVRADHLVSRCLCPVCRKNKRVTAETD